MSDPPVEPAPEEPSPKGPGNPVQVISAPAPVPASEHTSIWARIKEHKIAEWTLAYVAFGFAFLHGVTLLSDALEWPHIVVRSVTLLLIVGLPVVPTLAWYHGVRALKRVSGSELLIIALLLAIGGGLLWLVPRPTAGRATPEKEATIAKRENKVELSTPPAPSIAVLPFVDMSEKKNQEYFADGMAEELVDSLARIPGIRVMSRTSSFQFRGQNEDASTIGRKLQVAYILEGSVRTAGSRVRVTAQLIDVRDGSHRWSGSYDRDLLDVLKVQDEISVGLVRALQVSMGADEPTMRPTLKSVEGYSLYLKGRLAFDRLDEQGFDQGVSYLRQAMQLDPESALAPAWLAIAYIWAAEKRVVEHGTGFEEARRSAERARMLDPRSELAVGALGLIHVFNDWDWAAATTDLDHALSLAPGSATILFYHGVEMTALGKWEAAIRDLNASVALDPLLSPAHFSLGRAFLGAGRWSEAEAAFRKVLEVNPTYVFTHSYLATALLFRGEKEAAFKEIDLETNVEEQWAGRAAITYALGRRAESDAALKRLTELASADWAYGIACVHAYRGENDVAFLWLERAFTQKDANLWAIKAEPFLRPVEGDPRYKALLKKLNLPE